MGFLNPYGIGLMTIPYYVEIMGVLTLESTSAQLIGWYNSEPYHITIIIIKVCLFVCILDIHIYQNNTNMIMNNVSIQIQVYPYNPFGVFLHDKDV